MSGWPRVKLGSCCTIVCGSTPRRDNPCYWDGPIAWATPRDISSLDAPVLRRTAESITEEGYRSCSTALMPAGSVLFTSRAPIGLVAIAGIPVCTNQGFKSLVAGPSIEPAYLYWCMRHLGTSLAARGSGSTFAEVSKEVVSRFEIPVPTRAEQRRIAALLDKTDDVRRIQREQLRLVDELLRSAFLTMFGSPLPNDRGWPTRQAGEVICAIDAGSSVAGDARPPRPGEWAVLKISAVTRGKYAPAECKVVLNRPPRPLIPKKGDLLFTRANTRELVAATCLVDRGAAVFLPDKIWRLTPNVERADAAYLHYLFSDPGFRGKVTQQATGTSGSMLNVSQAKVMRLALPLPPLALQRRFASLVWAAYDLRERMDQRMREVVQLASALAFSAFRA